MAEETFTVKIVTPSGAVLQEQASTVTLVGADGELGILTQHAKYTGVLGTGILKLKLASNEDKTLVISGGFCNFSESTLLILADYADFPSDINRDTYAAEKPRLESALADCDTQTPEWLENRRKLARIEAIQGLFVKH